MNKRRMANRHESMHGENQEGMKGGGGVGSTGKGEHDYAKDAYGKGHEVFSSSGSYMHREIKGPGPLEGAGEVTTGGPGVAAERKASHSEAMNFMGEQPVYKTAATSKTPKGMKVYDEGE